MKTSTSAASAKEKLGIWTGTSLVAGTMIGSGVFLLPSSLAAFGGISLAGWLVSSTGAILIALMLSRLSRHIPKSGGPYAYTRSIFGDALGFLVGWGYWFALLTGGAAISVAAVGYLGIFFPVLTSSPFISGLAALVIIWSLVGLNILGVREAGGFQLATLILKLLPLIMVIITGLLFFREAHFQPFNLSGGSALGAVTATGAMTLWAFGGLESASVAAEDIRDPERNVTKVTTFGVLLAAGVYTLSTFGVMAILPPEVLGASSAPFADVATRQLGPAAGSIVAIGAIISCLGALNGLIFVQGRIPYAMGRDQLFPRRFGQLSQRGTPAFALIISGLVVTLFMALNYSRGIVDLFTYIVLLSTMSLLLPYVFSAIAELVLLVKWKGQIDKRRLTRNLVLGILAYLFAMWMITGVGQEAVYWGLMLWLVGLPVYAVMRWQEG